MVIGDEFSCLWRDCARERRAFNARYKLLIHMRVHSGHKPNRCHVSTDFNLHNCLFLRGILQHMLDRKKSTVFPYQATFLMLFIQNKISSTRSQTNVNLEPELKEYTIHTCDLLKWHLPSLVPLCGTESPHLSAPRPSVLGRWFLQLGLLEDYFYIKPPDCWQPALPLLSSRRFSAIWECVQKKNYYSILSLLFTTTSFSKDK